MSAGSVLIYNACLVDRNMDTPGAVLVENGKITAVLPGSFSDDEAAAFCERTGNGIGIGRYNAHGLVLMPAFIDMHVHFRYPGLTEKEDLNTGLHAAAAGGVGTVVAMPNTKPVVSSFRQAADIEAESALYGLATLFQTVSLTSGFGGIDTSSLDDINPERVPVVSEDGYDVASASVMFEAMKKAASEGLIVSCHCEDPALAAAARPYRTKALALMREYAIPAWGTQTQSENIPASVEKEIDSALTEANRLLALAEDTATLRNLELARAAGCSVHIAHVSTKRSIDAVCRAKQERPSYVSCEVTPHHFALCGTEAPLLRALVNPPLRSEADRIALVEALKTGTADVISTDHAPHTVADKASGSPGFSGLEVSYAAANTVLVHQNGFTRKKLSELMSGTPAKLLHLCKGQLVAGYDADLVLTDPDEIWTVDSSKFASKGKATPFNGRKLRGKVHATFVAGREIYRL